MVEVTTVNVIDRIKSYLGLRGKAIVTSRNSIYPVMVVNTDQQQVPIRPQTLPYRSDITRILQDTSFTAGITDYSVSVYTVPSGKVAHISSFHLRLGANISCIAVVRNVANDTTLYKIASSDAVGDWEINFTVSLRLEAGESIRYYLGATGNADLSLYGWEEPA